ncbi:MAG: D-hexose-6-phosphate mutarotase [Phycisphaeraceae bacterium]|nr:D-hexose-6-phosphate mutarotase [Phycisphaeraceae bacterium]
MSEIQTIAQLQKRFGVPGALRFTEGRGGLTRAEISSPHGAAQVYLQGAHVTEYQPAGEGGGRGEGGGEPVLFVSDKSRFEPGGPIRGGVPVCLPWFAEQHTDAKAPKHGFVRVLPWEVKDASRQADGSVRLELGFVFAPGNEIWTRYAPYWPWPFSATMTVTVSQALSMALAVRNDGREAFEITEALHTYLKISDIRNVGLRGLAGGAFLDKTKGFAATRQEEQVLRFTGQTDRIYPDSAASCVVEDPGLRRRIVIAKRGSASTVVWNPWAERAGKLEDLGATQWPGMLCVETANAGPNAVRVEAGQTHVLEATIHAERM